MNPLGSIVADLRNSFPTSITEEHEFRGELTLVLSDPELLTHICQHLKTKSGFDMLLDITAVDNLGSNPRWFLVYHIFSTHMNAILRLRVKVADPEPSVPTVTQIWPAADWLEREVFDMFGIKFHGHPNLRRILMWDDYPYHPLRKDFPLAGVDWQGAEGRFTEAAPMEGGPFYAKPGEEPSEPRAHPYP